MDDPFQYRSDIYAWSRHQAEVLRRLADRPELPNDLDLEHVVEEIEDVGNSQLAAVESFIRLIFVHLIKMASVPEAAAVGHWSDEVATFYGEIDARYTDSMEQLVDLETIWIRAIRQSRTSLKGHGQTLAPSLPAACPFDLDDLLADELDIRELVSRLAPKAPRSPAEGAPQ